MKMQKKEELQKHNKELLQNSIHYESIDFPEKSSLTTLDHHKK
jgi:hypothetical protein